MKGDAQVIEVLNECLTAELTAINQYFVDAKMCEDWGYERLAQRFREDSMDEMRDAEALVDRILYLDGMPNLQRLGTVAVGETVGEKLTAALSLEVAAVERLNRGIATCIERGDHGSREVLQGILQGEEEHADWLEAQLGVLAQIGEANYLAQQLHA
ncbi:MAG: bacterioferritin [Actinomycetota bacterium]|nr:bacterioferritin [Actinomycetota bacterium]MDQ3681035.1 bacterioferritin [Actinomycetota bacterium]